MYDGLMESLCEHSMRIESAHVSGNIAPLKIITKNTGFHMKRIYLLCLMLCLAACGSETDTSLGMNNQPPSIEIKEHVAYRYTVVLANASDDAVITINDLPSWAEFDPETKLISGVPGHENADAEFTYSISAVDGEATFQSDDITISVVHSALEIVSLPKARTLLKELSEYSQSVAVESDREQLTFSLMNAPEWMHINATSGVISGAPNHSYVGQTYVITVKVSDGFHERNMTPFELTVTPLINLNPVISVTTNALGDFYINQNIEINFDKEIEDITSISLEAPNGACISNIQISEDDFSTCIALDPLYPAPAEVDYEIDPEITDEENEALKAAKILQAEIDAKKSFQLLLSTEKLELNNDYKVKVTTFVNEGFDFSIPDDYESSIYTVSGLIITEIGSHKGFDSMHWIEVYNASRSPVNLNEYKLRTRAMNTNQCDVFDIPNCIIYGLHDFSLNDFLVQPGQFIVIRSYNWDEDVVYEDNDRTTYLSPGFVPFWYRHGYVELININKMETEDFVSFGNWYASDWQPSPVSASAWGGQNYQYPPPIYNQNNPYSGSIGRSGGITDSNGAGDWSVYEVHTAGGPNDITDAETDEDQDGIPDYAEEPGATYAGMDLYELGARKGIKDIFIELDYMDSEDENVIPREEALQKVVDAFANQNIAVHFDAGDLFHKSEGMSAERFDLGGGNTVPFSQGITFIPSENDARVDLYDIKRENMDYARLPIFHYMLMAYSQQANGSSGSGGFAELYGNDSVITLGGWELNSEGEESLNALINIQAATIMHELGHNLGLRHGGHEDLNYKPNYLSIMNYLHAIDGLPTIGDNEGDRYYLEKNLRAGEAVCDVSELTNPVNGSYLDFIIDYSSSENNLNESRIFEENGLNHQGSTAVDFDCNGEATDTLDDFDVNFTNNITNLAQSSDWDSIILKFQKFNWGDFGRSLKTTQPADLKLIEDVIGDDISEMIIEEPPIQSVMERIQSY